MFASLRRISAVRHNNIPQFATIGKQIGRTIYSREEIGLPGIEEKRLEARQKFQSYNEATDRKAEIVSNFMSLQLNFMRDALKEFVYLSDFNQSDTDILMDLIQQFDEAYNQEVTTVKNAGIATDISRSCHLLNNANAIIQLYSNSNLRWVFNEQESHKIFLDLLFEQKRYEDVYTWYKKLRQDLLLYERVPAKTLNCLFFAACYHLNTPECFQCALDLWAQLDPSSEIKRSRFLLSALALKQNNLRKAAELISHLPSTYVTIKFLRIAIYTKSKHFEETFAILDKTLKANQSQKQKPAIAKHLIDDLQAAVNKTGKPVLIKRLNVILGNLNKQNLITDETLEQHLCAEFPPMLPKSTFYKIRRNAFIK